MGVFDPFHFPLVGLHGLQAFLHFDVVEAFNPFPVQSRFQVPALQDQDPLVWIVQTFQKFVFFLVEIAPHVH